MARKIRKPDVRSGSRSR